MEGLKFRAWLKKEKKLVEVLAIDFQYRQISIAPLNDKLNKFSQSGNQYCIVSPIPFNDCIIEQFTWLKDKNGDEIYEGDIVEVEEKEYQYNEVITNKYQATVVFRECCFKLVEENGLMDMVYNKADKCKVVGNIHIEEDK